MGNFQPDLEKKRLSRPNHLRGPLMGGRVEAIQVPYLVKYLGIAREAREQRAAQQHPEELTDLVQKSQPQGQPGLVNWAYNTVSRYFSAVKYYLKDLFE